MATRFSERDSVHGLYLRVLLAALFIPVPVDREFFALANSVPPQKFCREFTAFVGVRQTLSNFSLFET